MLRKKDFVTIITPIPGFIPRQLAIDILHSHGEVITLNPLVLEYKAIKAPRDAASDEYYSTWYEIIERIQYVPGIGRMGSGKISFNGCFHNMPWGLQAHIYAPMNIDMRYKYQIGGNQPGVEPTQPLEMGLLALGAPSDGLYLREDVEVKANMAVIGFVKSQLKAASKLMVERIIKKAELVDAGALHAMMENGKLKTVNPADRSHTLSISPSPASSPSPALGTTLHDRNSKRMSSQSSPPSQPGTPGSPPPIPYQVPRPQTTYSTYRPGSAGVQPLQNPGSPAPSQGLGLYGGGFPAPGYPSFPMHGQHHSYSGPPAGGMPGYYPQQIHPSMYGQYPPQQYQQPHLQYAELQAFVPANPQPVPQAPPPVEMVGDFYHAQPAPVKPASDPRLPYQPPAQGHDTQMQQLQQQLQQQHLNPSAHTSTNTTPQTNRDSDTLASNGQWSLSSQQQSSAAGSRPHSTGSDSGSASSGMVGGFRSPGLDKSFSSELSTHAETPDEHHQEALKKLDPVASSGTTAPAQQKQGAQTNTYPYNPAQYVQGQ